METRTRAAKKVVLGPGIHTLKEGEESVDSVDSGILNDSLISSTSNKSKKSRKHERKSFVQPISSGSQKNLLEESDIDKENDGNRANSKKIDQQRNETSSKKTQITNKSFNQNVSIPKASAIEESEKIDVLIENRRETGLKLRSAKTSTQKTSPKTIAAKRAEQSKEKSVAEEKLKLSQCPSDYDSKEILKWLQSRRAVGLWIKCCRENCGKWRFNDAIHDPIDVPKMWYCDMQLDPRVAYCDYPQQVVPPHILEDLIENKYNAGSIVWARLDGYPWWPAMVDDCPFKFRYYELGNEDSNIPIKYNVTFFAEDRVQCSWILDRNLQPYKWNAKEVFLKGKKMTYRGIPYKDQVQRCCVMADVAQQLPLYERLLRFSFVARSTDNAPVENVERRTGSHSKNSPVRLRTTGAIQKEVSGDNSKTRNETTAQQRVSTSRISSQRSVESQRKSARLSTMASNNKSRSINKISGDETSTRKNASAFGKYPQTSCESQKSIQEFSQVASDNTRPECSILQEKTAQQTASTSRIDTQIGVESQKKSARLSTVASNNKSRSIKTISGDETSTRKNASAFGKYPQTSCESQKSIQEFSQVASDNTRPESSILQERTAQQMASTSKIDSQISAESQKSIQGFSQLSSNKTRPRRKIFSADGASNERSSGKIHPQTSFDNQNDNERLNVRSRRMKNVSVDEPFMQNSGSNFGVHQQTSIESKEKRKPQPQVSALNKTPETQKSHVTLSDTDQNDIELPQRMQTPSDFNQNETKTDNEIKTKPSHNLQLLDELLNHLRPNRTKVGDNSTIPSQATAQQTASTSKIHTRTSVKSQEKSETLFKAASNNGNPGPKKIWCDDKSSNERRALSPKTSSQTSAEIWRNIESVSAIFSNNGNLIIGKESPMQLSAPIFGAQQTRSVERNTESKRPPQTVSNNEGSKIKTVPFGELPMQFPGSIFGEPFFKETSQDKNIETKRRPQIVANNERSKIKKVSFCESPMLFSDSIFGVQQETSVERKREIKRLPQTVANNEGSKIKTVSFSESPMIFSDSDFGVQQETSVEKKKEIKRSSQTIANNEDSKNKKVFFSESPMLFSDSDFGVQQETSVERINEKKRPPQTVADNEGSKNKKVFFSESPLLFSDSDFGVQQETSVERKNEKKRPPQTVANNEGSKNKKVFFSESPMLFSDSVFGVQLKVPSGELPMLFSDSIFGVQQETRVEKKREIKRPPQTVANNEGSKIKKVSIDQQSMQLSSGLNSGVDQQTSAESKEKTKKHSQVSFSNQTPGIRKSWCDNLSPIQPPSDQSIEMETDDEESPYF